MPQLVDGDDLCIMQQSKQLGCDDGQEDKACAERVDKDRSEIIEAIFAREVAGQENFQTIEAHRGSSTHKSTRYGYSLGSSPLDAALICCLQGAIPESRRGY